MALRAERAGADPGLCAASRFVRMMARVARTDHRDGIDLIQIKTRDVVAGCFVAAYHLPVPSPGFCMIVLRPACVEAPYATMWLKPNRTLSRRGLRRLIIVLVTLVLGTAGLGAWQGNVFAPLFAVLESIALAYALSIAWRSGDRGERIVVDATSLEVQSLPGRRCTRFPAYWVRVLLQPANGRHRLLLSSHGNAMEVGVFLAEAERVALSKKLMVLLMELHDRPYGQVQQRCKT